MNELRKITGGRDSDHSNEWLPLLSEYIDKRLEAALRLRLERHLSECRECRVQLASLRRTVRALNTLPEVRVPRSFTISPAQARSLRPRPLYRASQFAAAVAAAFLLISFVLDFAGVLGSQNATSIQASFNPTVEAPVVGTRPPAPTCAPDGQNCAFGAATLSPADKATPDPTTVAAVPTVAPDKADSVVFRVVQFMLALLVIVAAAFAYSLRPRAPTRFKL